MAEISSLSRIERANDAARDTASYTFRDAALRSRPLLALNQIGRALAALGLEVPSLSIDSILSAAKKQAGTSDLGGDSYREPLERYLDAVHAEADLNTFGRIAVRQMLVGSLANRGQLAAWARDHPEVHDEKISEPWVILGLPRTGTSLLSILLGLDPQSRALMHWEGAHPIPPPTLATAAEDSHGEYDRNTVANVLRDTAGRRLKERHTQHLTIPRPPAGTTN